MHLIFLGAKEMSTFFLCDTKSSFLRLFSFLQILESPSRFNPEIMENSSKNFSKILGFLMVNQTDFWKNHPFFRNFNFFGHGLERFREKSSIFGTWPG